MQFHVILLSLSFLAIPQIPDNSACVQPIEKPSYPQVARSYDSQGTVTAHFTIGEGGKVQNAVYESKERITPEGNKTLAMEVQFSIERRQLDPQCKGEYSLVYHFMLDKERSADPQITVVFNAPNEFVIKAKQDLLTCSVFSIEKPSLRRRLTSKLLSRGAPSRLQHVECY